MVKVRAVLGIVGHGEGGTAHRQEQQKAHMVGAVPGLQVGGVQRGAQGIHLVQEGVALLRVHTAPQPGLQRIGMTQGTVLGSVVVIKPGRHPIVRCLFADPVHGHGHLLLGLGPGLPGPDAAGGRVVEIDADQHGGFLQQPDAAIQGLLPQRGGFRRGGRRGERVLH